MLRWTARSVPVLSVVALLGVIPLGAAQRTWIVDQANFTDLPAALNAANDGDVILCRTGNYTGATTSPDLVPQVIPLDTGRAPRYISAGAGRRC